MAPTTPDHDWLLPVGQPLPEFNGTENLGGLTTACPFSGETHAGSAKASSAWARHSGSAQPSRICRSAAGWRVGTEAWSSWGRDSTSDMVLFSEHPSRQKVCWISSSSFMTSRPVPDVGGASHSTPPPENGLGQKPFHFTPCSLKLPGVVVPPRQLASSEQRPTRPSGPRFFCLSRFQNWKSNEEAPQLVPTPCTCHSSELGS